MKFSPHAVIQAIAYPLLRIAPWAFAAYLAVIALIGIVGKLLLTRPESPWMPAIVGDGLRASQGLPVYEAAASGHATLMYGPAQSQVLGALFHVFPATGLVPQLLALVSSIGLISLAVLVLRRFLPATVLILVVCSLVGIEITTDYLADGRPDMPAWLLGFGGLVLIYMAKGHRRGRALFAVGTVLMVLAVTFKQTTGMLTLIPPIATLLDRDLEKPWLSRAASLLPGIGGAVFLVGTHILAPTAFFYMVSVPGSYPAPLANWPKAAWAFVVVAPCLWYAIAAWRLGEPSRDEELHRRVLWTAVAATVCLLLGCLTLIKVGGGANSLVPAWLTIIPLCWLLLSPTLSGAAHAQGAKPWGPAHLAITMAAFALALAPDFPNPVNLARYQFGATAEANRTYGEAVAQVRRLEGVVLSPEDPSITYQAKGVLGRSIYAENDATGWVRTWPAYMDRELRAADYLVNVTSWAVDAIKPADLTTLGFERVWSNPHYEVWKSTAPAVTATSLTRDPAAP